MLSSRALLMMVKSMVPLLRARCEGVVKAQYVLKRMLERERDGAAAAVLSAARMRGRKVRTDRRRDVECMVV
jgi:hypothetical protein